jgi:hypothetical protein
LHDLLNDENNDQNESQYNLITNYDYPINIYYNETAINELNGKEVLLISIIGKNKDQDGKILLSNLPEKKHVSI